jgi:hypothetical protein
VRTTGKQAVVGRLQQLQFFYSNIPIPSTQKDWAIDINPASTRSVEKRKTGPISRLGL